MAGPIQSALSGAVMTAAAIGAGAKKAYENEKQISEKASAKAEAESKAAAAMEKEAKESALEADLIRMGADPESTRAFMNARELGLDTKHFGMIRKKGKFVGSYSSLAEKLSKDSLTDSLSSKVLNKQGFAARVVALGKNRQERVEALRKATEEEKRKGGKK